MYELYDAMAYARQPMRKFASGIRSLLAMTPHAFDFAGFRLMDGMADMYLRSTRYGNKPDFNIGHVNVDGKKVKLYQTTVLEKPFGNLVRFTKENQGHEPKVLIIAPISGHYATLQRDTVQRMAQKHDVYITDWKSVSNVPLSAGDFDLDTYLTYLIDFVRFIGPNTHVMAICQPAPEVLALAAIMEEAGDPCAPATIIPMGGPVDPRVKKTQVNELAESHSLKWFETNFLTYVPEGHIGAGRRVYPGFIQITAFINMNPDAHYKAHLQYLEDKVNNNQAGIERHTKFYDEYLSVLDMDAVYYLETVEKIFQTYEIPRGVMKYKGKTINLKAIKNAALLVLEGEKDDISAPGQCKAALNLCSSIPDNRKDYYLQPGVGHYGVFSGSKWRSFVAPKVEEFIKRFDLEIGTEALKTGSVKKLKH
ncbi:MAG: polyhydroxyalkanoate depolymerase [Alphaproteobacteria bacterium]|nr:polyhydroxyalkanoate depolymerase [Alphaproteobacteria bacterium]